ncbi:hypothetical protein E4T52_10323 [Aureobasidium sp. EXF-3400]|nr:hypothetical protein E4T51_11841 [Aureobasidium sp. EXF-12344]KAI4774724.1 hypothetical protein E4T52_10323 [Aureobasidium sp. EXF-3400]
MEIVSISSLSPSSAPPPNCGFKALVTLLWPFSSATGQCALLLADPDARQRYLKGQVRVRFTGPSAHQIAVSGIGIGDSVQVALVGVQWLTESLVKTPGRSVDGELIFNNRLHMIITRGEKELKTIDIDEPTRPTSPKSSMLPPSTPVARSKPRTSFDAYGVAVYSSPAFMRRLRLSEGGTPYSPVSVSEDDDQDTVASRKRRRVSYKNVSEWKFDAREPSPEKDQDAVLKDVDGDDSPATETTVPGTATIEAGNVTQPTYDLEMQDADGPPENVGQQVEPSDSEAQSIEPNAAQPALSVITQDPPVEAAEEESPEMKTSPRSAVELLDVQESEEEVAEAAVQQSAQASNPEEAESEGAAQAPASSVTSHVEVATSLTMPSSTLPRLTVLPTESELLEQMARARNIDRPITPILQPLLTEGLPLPSPFPTSAQKMPSPVFSKATEAFDITEKKPAEKEVSKTAVHTSSMDESSQSSSSGPENQLGQPPESNTVEAQESSKASLESVDPSLQESGQQAEATSQKSRIVADTYDGHAEEHPVQLLSDSEDADGDKGHAVSPGRLNSANGRSDDDTASSSEDSESDEASSIYDAEQIFALQEESGDEGAIEEPDWSYLERKLEQEEAALQQSREDLTARDSGLVEADDDLQVYDADDAVMHDDNSELGEDILARSDDDSADDDSDSSGYFDRAVMPGSDEESSGDSEVEMMDQSYQPSMPENAMYSHPFGVDGAHALTETRTALHSQATSDTGSVVGDETIAWRDMDAAVESLAQQAQPAQSRIIEPAVHTPARRQAPLVSSSRLDVVELLDDSESEGEDESNPPPIVPETVDFISSLSLVSSLLNNKQKDAHLEFSGPVTIQIRSEIKKISDQADSQSTKWTKYNALKAVCKIGTAVAVAADSTNIFAEAVKYRLKEDEVLVNVCWKIYNKLSNEEKFSKSQPTDLLDCLEELEEKRDYCFDGFADFLKDFKQNYHHMPRGPELKQLDQSSPSIFPNLEDQEVQRQPIVEDKDDNHTPTPQAVEEQDLVSSAEQQIIEEKMAEPSEQPEAESENQGVPEIDAEAAMLSQANLVQDKSAPLEDVSFARPESMVDLMQTGYEADGDESEVMSVEADSVESVDEDEHEIDPALLEEEYEIDPALLEDSSQSEGYEIDPALLEEEHEIDPALLAETHDDMPSNDRPSSPQADETMPEAPEPAAVPIADDEESNQQSFGEEVTSVADELMTDVPSPTRIDEEAVAQIQEAPLKSEVQQSVETDHETLPQPEVDAMETETSLTFASEVETLQKVKEELRPLSSSSFRTLSPTPGAAAVEVPEPTAEQAAQDSHVASQVIDQPIEELDLSQAEPSWTSRFSQFSQSRSSRAHTRSETIPDSADEEATDLEAENIDDPSRPASQEPATQTSPSNGALKLSKESLVQPSQELGTAFSQAQKQAHGPSGLQSQLSAITETPLSDEEEETAHEMQSQVGIDDELLADYEQVITEPEALPIPSELPSVPSTPVSTKKPARPLTLFRGRQSIGTRSSIGGDEQQAQETEQQTRDSEHQAVQDEEMQDVSAQESKTSTEIARVTEGTIESDKQVQDEVDPKLVPAPSPVPEARPQPAQEPQAVKEATPDTAAPEPEALVTVEQLQVPEVEQASSDFQLKPTLKPFAEVEASLFGTPIKGKTAAPQEPQSAPSQTWRNTLSSKMSEVGSWFTPRRTTEVQKSATEHKATTSSTSFMEETPTKAAATISRDRQKSISPPPLQRYASQGTSTSLSYFTPLAGLHQHLNQQSSLIDIVAVCTTATATAERAKSGPKDYYTTFRLVDQPLYEYNTASQDTAEGKGVKDVKVEVFRPFRQSLPKASPGDVVLLRGFVVRSRNHKNYLLSTAASGWCVWRYGTSSALDYEGQEEEDDRPVWARKGTSERVGEDGVREEVTGPPVEIGDEEREKVAMVKKWWETLQKGKKTEEKEEPDVIMID